jgi:hypothetical protein
MSKRVGIKIEKITGIIGVRKIKETEKNAWGLRLATWDLISWFSCNIESWTERSKIEEKSYLTTQQL